MIVLPRKIKVAQVITRMDWGGSPDVLRLLVTHLDPLIFEQHLFIGDTCHPSASSRKFFAQYKEKITWIPALKRDIHPWNDCAALWQLYRALGRGGFDVVHTHTAKAGALGRIAARLAGVPVVVHTAHGHNLYGYANRLASCGIVLIERFLSLLTDKLVVLTDLERNDCIAYGIARAEQLVSMLTAFSAERVCLSRQDREDLRSRYAFAADEQVIGFVGRLEPVKGADLFVDACLDVLAGNEKAKAMVVGEGSLRQELESRVKGAGMQKRVLFTGWQENAACCMPAFDLMVLPSRNEAVGIVLLEAMSQKVPVIAAAVGGIPEIIQDKTTGMLVPAVDKAALAAAIVQLLADPDLRARLAEEAFVRIQHRYDPQVFADNNGRLYLDLASRKGRTVEA